jgi:hypothetical protein
MHAEWWKDCDFNRRYARIRKPFIILAKDIPLGRTRHRWEDNIKMDIQEVVCGGMVWIVLSQNRDRKRAVVNAVMNLLVP